MGQSGPGNSPEIGRPRGAVWRTLVSEGIVWEGQVTIAGEHSDIDVRLIVTGQRVVFVRNGTIALDAERDWLDPAPALGRNGRVSLAISTPNGNGPIPVEIRVRDGRFGATRLLARLNDRPGGSASPFSPPPPRPNGRERAERGTALPPASSGRRSSRSAPPPRPTTRPTPPPVPVDPPATSHFGIPSSALPSTVTPMPSFGVAVPSSPPGRPLRSSASRPSGPSPAGSSSAPVDSVPSLSVAAVSRAFGERTDSPDTDSWAASGSTQTLPENPTRWTLASELLARSGPAAEPPPAPDPAGHAQAPAFSSPSPEPTAAPVPAANPPSGEPLALSSGPPPSAPSTPAGGREIPSSLRDADPVSHARPADANGSRRMLPGLPASDHLADPASDRRAVSAAPSGRLAGNSVITARSSAAARQAAKQGGMARLRPDELSPSAVALASARAGVPLALTPGPVPVSDIPVMADAAGSDRARRGGFAWLGGGRVSARAAWGATAFALVALTVAAGLYLALGIPTDDGGDRSAGLAQPTVSESGQVAIVAATPSASARTMPTATATNAVPRGVGGESNGVIIPTRAVADPATADGSGDTGDPPATEPSVAPGNGGVEIAATEDTRVETAGIAPSSPSTSAAPSIVPSAPAEPSVPAVTSVEPTVSAELSGEPSVAPSVAPSATATEEPTAEATVAEEPTATAEPTVEPTATPEPTVEPTATATATATATEEPTATIEPTVDPTATVEPTVTAEPTATIEPTAEPTATEEATATIEPTAEPTATTEPTATMTSAPTPTPGPDVEPQPATVDDGGVPSQVFTVGSVRYTIESVAAGATIPEINQPQSPFGGDWLAAVLTAENWGTGDAVVDMTQFTATINSSGQTQRLDTYSETVAIQLGFPQVVGASQQISIAPGSEIRLGLLFLTAQNASGFVLNAGTATIDLTAAFNSSIPMNQLGEPPVAPDLLEATVVGVIDGVTIEVEVDGEKVPVRYTGVVAPDVESCFSGTSIIANRDLVMGRTVWLERQNANVDSDGAWLRDVWIEGDSGSLELVSAVLVTAGAIDATVELPDSRYAAYLGTLASIARYSAIGIWAVCGA